MNFALYSNRFLSSFADYGLMFFVPLIVFQSTGSASLSGLAFAVEYLVKVFFGPIAGLLIDRFGSPALITLTDATRFAACFVFVFAVTDDNTFALVMFLAVINGLGYTLNFLGQESLLTDLEERSRFAKVQAYTQTLAQIALVSAPVVSAWILVQLNAHWLISLYGAFFLISLVTLKLGLRGKHIEDAPDSSIPILQQLKSNLTVGHVYLVKSVQLQKVVASTFLINLIYGTLLAIGAIAVTGLFEKDAQAFATMQSLSALSAISILLIVSRLTQRFTPTQLGFIAFLLMGAGGFIAGLSQTYFWFVLGAILILSFDGVFNVYIRTRRMEIIDRKDFGKAIGLLMIVNNLSKPLSGLIVFLLSPWLEVTKILLLMSCFAVSLTLAFRLFSSTARKSLTVARTHKVH